MSITNEIHTQFPPSMQVAPSVQPFTEAALAATFPAQFLWGAATASYQVEGATHEDGRGPSIWDTFAATPGKVHQGENGDRATDHYHLFQDDIAMMARIGLGGYRFSIAWPRILPSGRGAINDPGLDFYDRLVDALLAKGIQPFATLYHWDLPQTLQDAGGWTNRDTAYAYADYAELVVKRLGDRVAGWITQNEPWCIAFLGYGIGIHAPGDRDLQAAVNAGHHVLLAHGLALPRIRAHMHAHAQVGISLNFTPVYPVDDRPETKQEVERADTLSNRWFLDALFRGSYPDHLFSMMGVTPPIQDGDMALISAPLDFLGINNYSRMIVRGHEDNVSVDNLDIVERIPGSAYTDMGWEVHPQSLHDLLLRLHREYAIPALYITENGAAFTDQWNGNEEVHDPLRIAYLREYLSAISSAMAQGVPLKGYFVWSLMDNFEWAEGYSKRFGIVYIDYPSQRRIWKDSAHWYANLISAHKQAHRG